MVGDSGFIRRSPGQSDSDVVTSFIQRAVDTLPVMDQMTATETLKVLYETEFGICDHLAPDHHPFSSVLHHPSEEVWMNSGLRDLIEEFAIYNYGELFNMSLTEYLSLPRPYVSMIRQLKDSIIKKREAIVASVERGIFSSKA